MCFLYYNYLCQIRHDVGDVIMSYPFARTEFVECKKSIFWEEDKLGNIIYVDYISPENQVTVQINPDEFYLEDALIYSHSLNINDHTVHTVKLLENGNHEHTLFFFSEKKFHHLQKLVEHFERD